MTTQIATVTITEDVRAAGTILYAGTYRVEMPADYDPAIVTGEDILLDDSIRVVSDDDTEGEEVTRATVTERGNGLPGVGDLLVDHDSQDVYRVTARGRIQAEQWESNSMRVEVEHIGSMWDEDEGSDTFEGEEIFVADLRLADDHQ